MNEISSEKVLFIVAGVAALLFCYALFYESGPSKEEVVEAVTKRAQLDYPDKEIRGAACRFDYDDDNGEWECRVDIDGVSVPYECENVSSLPCKPD